MDHQILGKVLATIVVGAIDAGAIATDSSSVLANPDAMGRLVAGFLSIWITHQASGAIEKIPAPKG